MTQGSSSPKTVIPTVAALTIMWGTNWGLFQLAVREVSVWTFRAVSLLLAAALVLAIAKVRADTH